MEEIEKKIKELLSKDRGSEGISSGALGMVNGVLKVLEVHLLRQLRIMEKFILL